MILAFTAAVLVSAALLFVLEPMFARMVLPLLGGSPAVWNTALVFYQVALLAGYGYVHWSTTRLGARRQALLHAGLVLAALISLPVAIPAGWTPPTQGDPIPWMLLLLTVALGLPFLVVSTTGPLMQKWFSSTRHPLARDPYFLYAASNFGSMVGLLAYPLLIEPRLRLADQSRFWAWGYGALAALILGCAILARRRAAETPSHAPQASPLAPGAGSAPTIGRRLRWALLAFAPSSLMMGVTTHVTTDIAAVPLLWVVPLALYLLSFTLAFARRGLPHTLWVRALPLLVLPLLVVMLGRAAHPIVPIVSLHLLVLFVAAMVCHGELAKDRPPAEYLTGFYMWLALGGALGGIFNAIVAPLAFDAVVEYPIALALACMLAPRRGAGTVTRRVRILDLALPLAVAGIPLLVIAAWRSSGAEPTRMLIICTVALLTFPMLRFSPRPFRFGLAVGALLLSNPLEVAQGARGLYAERSFFGMHRVMSDPVRGMNALYHGTTLHGLQKVRPRACAEPLGYYGKKGPLGDVFQALGEDRIRSVAVAGLGTGGIAAYARPGQSWTFFEIDPVVERIASDSAYFCYLESAAANCSIVLGDARLSLANTGGRFDLIILDAYSSDAIPVHLLTREALALYQSRLTERGVMAFHISNQYFELAPVVARLAADAGLVCRVRHAARVDSTDLARGLLPSHYAVIARTPDDLGGLASDDRWESVDPGSLPLWTDDYSSLFSVLQQPKTEPKPIP